MASTTKVCDQYYCLLLELPTSYGSVLLGSRSESGEQERKREWERHFQKLLVWERITEEFDSQYH